MFFQFVLFGFEVCGEWFCTTHHLKHFIQRFKQFFSSRNDTFPSDPDEQHWIKPRFRNPYLRKVGLKLKMFFRVSRSIVIATFFIGKGKVACDEAILNYHKLNLKFVSLTFCKFVLIVFLRKHKKKFSVKGKSSKKLKKLNFKWGKIFLFVEKPPYIFL